MTRSVLIETIAKVILEFRVRRVIRILFEDSMEKSEIEARIKKTEDLAKEYQDKFKVKIHSDIT